MQKNYLLNFISERSIEEPPTTNLVNDSWLIMTANRFQLEADNIWCCVVGTMVVVWKTLPDTWISNCAVYAHFL